MLVGVYQIRMNEHLCNINDNDTRILLWVWRCKRYWIRSKDSKVYIFVVTCSFLCRLSLFTVKIIIEIDSQMTMISLSNFENRLCGFTIPHWPKFNSADVQRWNEILIEIERMSVASITTRGKREHVDGKYLLRGRFFNPLAYPWLLFLKEKYVCDSEAVTLTIR